MNLYEIMCCIGNWHVGQKRLSFITIEKVPPLGGKLWFIAMRKVELLCWNNCTVLLWGIWITSGAGKFFKSTSGAKRRKKVFDLHPPPLLICQLFDEFWPHPPKMCVCVVGGILNWLVFKNFETKCTKIE